MSESGSKRHTSGRPKIILLYHYFHPDDVISARNFSDLAEALANQGWSVEAWPSNRSCRDENKAFPRHEVWQGVQINRVWRPPLRQSSTVGRLANALYMIGAWSTIALKRGQQLPNIVLMGTDPVLSVLVAGIVKRVRPQIKMAHWVHDLYPEAPLADGMLKANSIFVRCLHRLLRWAYRSCDWVADLGPCMRERLEQYGHKGRKVTLVPWGVSEPMVVQRPDPIIRERLFGQARLALLYSGNFGRAHSYETILNLARRLRHTGIQFTFAVRGNRVDELRSAVGSDDVNIRFAPFAEEKELAQHLAAADIHLASLRTPWTGVVVPSKFFGSLAAGRPVLFAGDDNASIARWIREYRVGWHLSDSNLSELAMTLEQISQDASGLQTMQQRCFDIYHQHFCKRHVIEQFERELSHLL